MSWPAKTYVKGNMWEEADADSYLRDPLIDLRAGGIVSAVAQDFIFAFSSTQLGRVAASAGKIPRYNGVTGTWELALPLEFSWPVGSVYRSVVATNPNTLFGFGTWGSLAPGRVTVAFDAGDLDFNNATAQGGSKTHTLTVAELPSHTHTQDSHNHTQNAHDHRITGIGNSMQAGDFVDTVMDNNGSMSTQDTTATNNATAAVNQNTGGGGAHNNLMPYICCYVWWRTS